MSNMTDWAKAELQRAGAFDEDSMYGGMLGHAVLKMVEQFAEEGHSGTSASIAAAMFNKLARWTPLTPLTGDDDEWNEIGEEDGQAVYQNRRCSRVFRVGGRAYDIEGAVFREPDGTCFTNRDSRRDVTFPYMPATEYVDVPADRA